MIFTKSTENHQNEPKIPIKSMCVGYIRGLGRFLRIFFDFLVFQRKNRKIMENDFQKTEKAENHEI